MLNEKLYGRVFNWSELPTEVARPGVSRSGYATDTCLLVSNFLEFGMQENPHVHDDFDQLATIVEGTAHYFIDGEPHFMGPGSMMLVPAGSVHFIRPLEKRVVNLDIFTPPRSDLMHLVNYLNNAENS